MKFFKNDNVFFFSASNAPFGSYSKYDINYLIILLRIMKLVQLENRKMNAFAKKCKNFQTLVDFAQKYQIYVKLFGRFITVIPISNFEPG